MISLSIVAGNAGGDAIAGFIDSGSTQPNGYIEIRTGSKPDSPSSSPTGILLARCSFSNPAFGKFINKRCVANPISQDQNVANNGKAGWFRVYNRDDNAVFDGEIGVEGSGSDLELDNIDLVKGGKAGITTMILKM